MKLTFGNKGQGALMALIVGAIVVFISVYTVMQIITSIGALPTNTVTEQITFTANNTEYPVSYPYINSVASISNATNGTWPSGTGDDSTGPLYGWSANGVTLYANLTWVSGNAYNVSYTYNARDANNTYANTQTTFWSSLQLGAISLITLAASLVLGSFFFK